MDYIEDSDEVVALERCDFFLKVQVWPLSGELDYKGWLSNFAGNDKKIAEKILNFFQFFPKNMINQMLANSIGKSGCYFKESIPDWEHNYFKTHCIYTHITGEVPSSSDSGYSFIRKLKEYLGIPQSRFIDHRDFCDYLSQKKDPLPVIFVDDFVGSGLQCCEMWKNLEGSNGLALKEIAKDSNHQFVYAPLIMNKRGYDKIEDECPELILSPAHIIGDEYNLFNSECICWQGNTELFKNGVELILRKSKELGIPDDDNVYSAKGFKGQGLALAFEHGVPDAVPAFFYCDENGWNPLIKKTYKNG